MPRHHPDGFSCGVRTACKTSLRSSREHAGLAHQPCSTPSWLWDSLRTSRGTAWRGGPGVGPVTRPCRRSRALPCSVPSRAPGGLRAQRAGGGACWEAGQHGASGDSCAPSFHPCCPSCVTASTQIASVAQGVCKVSQALSRNHSAQGRVF